MSDGVMVGVPGGRVDAKDVGPTSRAWLIKARGTGLYYSQDKTWVSKLSGVLVKHGSERDAEAWWDFHGDDTLVWFERA